MEKMTTITNKIKQEQLPCLHVGRTKPKLEETRPKRLFRLFAIEIPTMVMRLAAHIVLLVFVVYFISFIG